MNSAIEMDKLAEAASAAVAWLKKHKAEASLLRTQKINGGRIQLEVEWNRTLDRMPVVQCGMAHGGVWLASRFSDHAELIWLCPKNA